MPASTFTAQMYNAFLGRAPDPAGYSYWVGVYPTTTETAIINLWAASPEAKSLNPYLVTPNPANADSFITALYQRLFGHAPDPAGLAYWSGQLQSQGVAPVILAFLGVNTGTDGAVLANRSTVGVYYATSFLNAGVGSTLTWEQTILLGVDDTAASVTAAKAQIDAWVSAAPLGPTLGTYAQILARARTYTITNVPGGTIFDLAGAMLAATNPTATVVGFTHNVDKLSLAQLYLSVSAINSLGAASGQTVASVFAAGPMSRVTVDGQSILLIDVDGDQRFSLTTDFVITGLATATLSDFVLA